MNPEQKKEAKKLKDAEKQRRYYAKKGVEIRKKKQDKRDEVIRIQEGMGRIIAPTPVPVVVPVVVPEVPSVNNLFNLEKTNQFLQLNSLNKNTRDKQIGALKALFRVSGINNIGSTMTTFNTVKRGIESGLQLNGKPYSIGSKALQMQVLLYLIDKMKIPMTEIVLKKYDDLYKELKIQEVDISREKKTDPKHAVLPYTTYLEQIEKKFGKDSKQFLIASMYNEVVARDNFGSLVIIPNLKDVVNKSQNYLIMPSNIELPMKMVLQKYKTVGSKEGMTFTLTQHLSNILRYYILNHKLTDKLFPEIKNGLLSAFITSMNKKIKIDGGINYIRHSKVSEFLATKPTPEERRIFSERTMHSLETQLNYNRVLVEEEDV